MATTYTIVITGGTGFLGSRIVRYCVEVGWSVVVLKRRSSNMARLATLLSSPYLRCIDIESFDVDSFFATTHVDVVIHTATSYGRNNETIDDVRFVNLVYPQTLVRASKQHHVPLFINTDTFFTEGIGTTDPEREYVYSKKEFLRYALSMFSVSDTIFVNMKVYQMYGPGDGEKKFVPFIISSFRADLPTLSLTAGVQTRDFIFVDDVAQAYSAVIGQQVIFHGGETVHLGTGIEHTIREVVEMIHIKMSAKTVLQWGALPYRDNEIMSSCAPIDQNPSGFRWTPTTLLSDGLDRAIALHI